MSGEAGFVLCPRCGLNWLKRGWDVSGCPRCALAITERALATSQADVTRLKSRLATAELRSNREWQRARNHELRRDIGRLAAELAESVRALAVSQGEVGRLREAANHWARWATELVGCESPEGVTDLIEERERVAERALADLDTVRGDLERARGLLAERLTGSPPCHGFDASCWDCLVRAFLLPPTASPEPDRASPEVTVKENETP